MLKLIKYVFLFFCFTSFFCFSQEELGPITVNLKLQKPTAEVENQKSLANSFDSTIIFWMDTLPLPLFDDFSTNKYQVREANFSDLDLVSKTLEP